MMMKTKMKGASIAACTLLLLTSQAFGATVTYMNYGSIGGGFGNSDTRAADNGSTMVTATAWSWKNGTFDTAQLQEYDQGLGVCNKGEGLAGGYYGCSGAFGEHTADNDQHPGTDGQFDFVLLQFDSQVTLNQGTLSYWSTDDFADADTDITFWTGLAGPGSDPQSNIFNNLTNRVDRLGGLVAPGATGTVDFSSLISDSPLDWLLIGAHAHTSPGNEPELNVPVWDAIKVKAIDFTVVQTPPAPVPIPPVFILFGTGLAGLVGLARRQKATSPRSKEETSLV